MKRIILLLIASIYCTFQLSAQDDQDYQNQFTAAILHVDQLQGFLQQDLSPDQITAAVDEMGYLYHQESYDHIWVLNFEQRVVGGRRFPMLILSYNEVNSIMRYASTDSTLIDYLLRDVTGLRYRSVSSNVWRNQTYELVKDHTLFDSNGDGIDEETWYLSLYDYKAAEERKRLYAEKLNSFAMSMDSLALAVTRVNDTARHFADHITGRLSIIADAVSRGDRYHDKHEYGKARQQYNEALNKHREFSDSDIKEAYAYIDKHYIAFASAADNMVERYKPLAGADLGNNYSQMLKSFDSLEYFHRIFSADNFAMDLSEKIKANDCDELYQKYGHLYSSREALERIYGQKGYDQFKKDAETMQKAYIENRTKFHNRYAALLSFLNISDYQFEKMYDDLGESVLANRLDQSRDSILLCAIKYSPDLPKASLNKKRVLKVDKKYRTVLNTSTVNLDDHIRYSYYPQIVDIALAYNEHARKEYAANGHYFSTKVSFFNAYVSSNYSNILQNYKRQEKQRLEQEAREREQARKQAEYQEKLRQQRMRQEQAERRRNNHRTAYPPIEHFAMGMNTGLGFAFGDDFGIDYHLGLFMMFPSRLPVSFGWYGNFGFRGSEFSLYLDGGLQFFHGQSYNWQFLWGVGAGVDFNDGIMGTVRIGSRRGLVVLYGDFDFVPDSDCPVGIKLGVGLNFGH